ncbi:MAG: hypothetical protein QM503_13635 [Bacteroidota bacterium]
MKKLFITVLVALFSISAFSQTKSEIDLAQAIFGIEKMQMVAAYVNPGEEYTETFINLYEEYEEKRMELGKVSIGLLKQYAEEWDGMTNEQADVWMKKMLDTRAKREKLITTYYHKVKKATNAIIATQFYQVETFILAAVRVSIYEEIPFVGEK